MDHVEEMRPVHVAAGTRCQLVPPGVSSECEDMSWLSAFLLTLQSIEKRICRIPDAERTFQLSRR